MSPARACAGPCPSLIVVLACLAAACASARERREAVAEIDATWAEEIPEDSLEEMVEHLDALGRQAEDRPDWLASVPVLARLANESPAALARADALRSGWRLARRIPPEPLRTDDLPAKEFSAMTRRFEELLAGEANDPSDELVELADFLGRYRFGPDQARLAVDLAELVTSRALWDAEGPVQRTFARHAAASARHALTLVTLEAADDPHAFVREEALVATRHLDTDTALTLTVGALRLESDPMVVLAALDSLEAIAPDAEREQVLRILELITPGADLAVRRRADVILAALAP